MGHVDDELLGLPKNVKVPGSGVRRDDRPTQATDKLAWRAGGIDCASERLGESPFPRGDDIEVMAEFSDIVIRGEDTEGTSSVGEAAIGAVADSIASKSDARAASIMHSRISAQGGDQQDDDDGPLAKGPANRIGFLVRAQNGADCR